MKYRKEKEPYHAIGTRSQLEGPAWCIGCAQRIVGLEFLSACLSEQRLGLGSMMMVRQQVCYVCSEVKWQNVLAGMLVAKSIDLCSARTHDVVGWRDVLVGPISGMSANVAIIIKKSLRVTYESSSAILD